jgi:prepilin peptidase CpaA
VRFGLIGFATGFGIYLLFYLVRAMGAGDVKLMGAVGSLVGWQSWFGVFIVTSIIGGVIALIVVIARRRVQKTVFNVGYILGEMMRGRPAYLTREDLDVRNPQAARLPHGAAIAVGTVFYLAISAHLAK